MNFDPNTGDLAGAEAEVPILEHLRDAAVASKQGYWEGQVEVLRLAASAWLTQAQGQTTEAIRRMRQAAELEDASEKSTLPLENCLYPMRELLADWLLDAGRPSQALTQYEASTIATPKRFNALSGAAGAALASGEREKATSCYSRLLSLAAKADTARPGIQEAHQFLARRQRCVARTTCWQTPNSPMQRTVQPLRFASRMGMTFGVTAARDGGLWP
jgi:tetratricopeptide (TPR) repeat protein